MAYTMTLRTVDVSYEAEEPIICCNQPRVAMPLLRELFEQLDANQEHMTVLALDTRKRPVGFKVCSSGTESQALVDPRQIFRPALEFDASGIIMAHNHPSGDLDPSRDDLELTRRSVAAGEAVGIRVLDHLILSPNGRWISLRETRSDLFIA